MSKPIDNLTGAFPLTSVSEQLARLQAINEMLLDQQIANAQAKAAQSTGGTTSSGGSLLGTIGSILGGGLGLAPLIAGLSGLFGGGSSSDTVAQPLPYLRPLPVNLDAGFSNQGGGAIFATDVGQSGSPRPIASAAPTHITVQIQALDSQSFLDRSGDIALAVRRAMLESTVLNDVIREV